MNKTAEKPNAKCIACRKKAAKFCDGWLTFGTPPSQYGQFSGSVGCGLPLCGTCTHGPKCEKYYGSHSPTQSKGKR